MMRVFAVVLFSFVLASGCGAVGGDEGSLVMAIDSTGPYPVLRASGTAPRWVADSLFVLGKSDGGPEEFGSVRSVLLDAAGSLYVVDPRYRVISIFDSTGQYVRRLGREGSGPGEYREPYSLARLDHHLAVLDPANGRISVFDTAGGWVATWPVQPITGGQFIRLYRTPPTFWTFAIRPAAGRGERVFVRYLTTGPADTVAMGDSPLGTSGGIRCDRPDGGLTFFSVPFGAAHTVVPIATGERIAAVTSTYRLVFLAPGGDTVRAVERDIPPVPISDAEWEVATAEFREFQQEWPTARCDRPGFDRPSVKPVLEFFFVDDGGRLWVEYLTAEGTRYDVLEPDGTLVATVEGLPSSRGIDPSVAGDRIAMVGRDSAEIPVVRVYRLRR